MITGSLSFDLFNELLSERAFREFVLADVKLAVFDCDGTLVDSQHAINTCMSDAFGAVGLDTPDISAVRRVVGLPLDTAIEALLNGQSGSVGEMVEAYSRSWQQMRASGSLDEPLFEGIVDVLRDLRSSDWILGVATGKSMRGLSATIAHHGLEGHFSTLQTADKARGKPDPEMLELAMAETFAEPENTLMIGDTTFDIEMAKSASVTAIGVAWGYHSPEDLKNAGAHVVADNMSELRQVLKEFERADK